MSNKKETIKRLIIFLVFAFALSNIPMLIYYFCAKTTDSPLYQFLGLITMFSPAAANILTRVITKEGFHHMGLRLHLKGHIKLYVLALLLPLIYTTIGGILGAACYGGFLQWEGFEQISVGYIITYIIYLIEFSVALCFYTMGEEFGWRGYMTPKLEQLMGTPASLIVGGLIWGIWHWSDIYINTNGGTSMNFWLMLGFQCITCFSLGACFTWLTKKSGSLFPAAIAHAVNNNVAGLLAIFFTTETIQKQHPDSLMLLDSLAILILGIIAFVLLITDAKNNGRKR